MAITIANMEIDDLEEVLLLWQSAEGVGLNESDTVECLQVYLLRNEGLSAVARSEGRVVSAVLCGHDGRRGYMNHLAVAEGYRRRGIGSELVERCVTKLKQLGILKCNIFVFAGNDNGSSFWTAAGWRDRSELKVMQRRLDDSPQEMLGAGARSLQG
jgi:ribosomal protein S18 acetylase RimI-like enzyme